MTDDSNAPEMPDIVPVELGGKWVAWDEEALHIVGSGDTLEEATAAAKAAGVNRPYLEKVPPANKAFIGRL
jgi:hypothetical protein